ncbi:MAG: Spy/CpxP family protein refolding chaperone [Terracidiphilus sp.]|nr:Spy/CpxP family protein refolding chaperone [Terracidiphilus sp.]MDR3797822.1 Spy/CpxP family protein refolding chaperone [Terracidiphilus sp.]
MKAMKIARLALVVAGVLMAGGLASAQGPGGQGMGPGMAEHRPPVEQAFGFANGQFWNNPNTVQQLNLTDDQRKAMDRILQDHKMKLIDLKANLEKAEVEMGPMMKADSPDQRAIEAQIDKVVAARAELEKANARFLLDIRMQLKPEQWKQLETLRMNRMQRQGMRGDGQDGRGGWAPGGQRPGEGGQFRGRGGPGGQFHRPQGGPPPADAPQSAPAPPPAPGSGDTQ